MAIRVEKDPMGMGARAWYVASAAEIRELSRSAAEFASALDRYLDALASQREFHPAAAPSL